MHRRPRLPSKSESFITEYMDFLVVLQSRASQSVVDSLCLCVQLLKASRGGITLFWPTNLRGAANIVIVVLVICHLEDQCGFRFCFRPYLQLSQLEVC